jgi:hypothetical protein
MLHSPIRTDRALTQLEQVQAFGTKIVTQLQPPVTQISGHKAWGIWYTVRKADRQLVHLTEVAVHIGPAITQIC